MSRATATVLFTDLVGSTELRGRLGEEAADELRRTHDRLLIEAVEASGGRVVKGLGDGLMATFAGAADAVGAAVAIQQAIDRLNRSGKAPVLLAVRVGLSSGDVSFEDDDVHGTPVIEASRLCAAAAGGEILGADVVRVLAGSSRGHDCVSVGPLELKALDHPVPAVRFEWEPAAAPVIPLPALLTDIGRIFVGRDAALERLQQLWKEVVVGERRIAFLAGEPGVGKTRLAAELASRVHAEGATVLAGRCDEDLGVPYQPFVEALRHFADHTPSDGLAEQLGRYGGELGRLVPELSGLPGLPAPLASDPETERYRLFDAVAAWLAAASVEEPMLLVLDDLQWAAKPTLLLLRHVVRSADATRVFVLVTYRDTDLGRGHPLPEVLADLRRQGDAERISLNGLDSLGVAAFMEQAVGHALDDDETMLARAIHDETEGNPFFVREVLRDLRETGAIERRDGPGRSAVPVEEFDIPESVREVVGRRLSRLSDASNRALTIAAVVGTEFQLPVLRAASGLDEDVFLACVDEATDARLVIETAPGERYRFAHALVRDTLYRDLSTVRRVALHRRVAEAVEVIHGTDLDDHLPALAYHWARASAPADTTKAAEYATLAGDRALTQLAHDEAAAYYRQALDLLGSADSSDDGDARRLELLISLGEAKRRAGDAAHRQTLLDAAALAQARGDADALARAALANHRGALWSVTGMVDLERVAVLEAALGAVGGGDGPTRARMLANLALELIWAGDRERRVRLSDEALAMARRLDDPATFGHVLVNRAYAIAAPSTLRERLANSGELTALSERLNDPVMTTRAWSVRFRAAMEAGDLAEADRCLEACEALASELGQPALRWVAGMHRAGRVLLTGDIEMAERLIYETLDLGRSAGQPDAPTLFAYQRVRIRFEQGRAGEVTGEIADLADRFPRLVMLWPLLALAWAQLDEDAKAREAYEHVAASGFAVLPVDSTWLLAVTDCAAVCAHLGDTARATTLRDLLSPCADQFPAGALGLVTGSVLHYLALLAATLDDFDEGDTLFGAAEAAHARIGALTWRARTRLEWARMLLRRRQADDTDRARDLLNQALATARELGLANVERRAAVLLQDGR